MTVFVTRPAPDNEKTAQALRARGYEVLLSPTMRFEAIAFRDDDDAEYDAVILTSANAIRAIENHAA
ncbi:MAG: uroporphyrinogen-III synthase, partial [Pseudomonadota bacterium]